MGRFLKQTAAVLFAALILLAIPSALYQSAEAAGIVTDTLTVKVGYYGLDEADFVEVMTLHWSDIEALLPLHEVSYSFYQDAGSAFDHDGDYAVTVVAAWGVYVEDLLTYANIHLPSVRSVEFYTQDRDTGYRSYFDASELFADRFYFEDLPLHLTFLKDADGKLLFDGYNKMQLDDSEAWMYSWPVRPMLALESSWESYGSLNAYAEFPYPITPNTANMSAASRFRLLFGQTWPGESGTQNRSAKYVHTLYVTLYGSAVYGSGVPELDGTIGSHYFDVDMIVENENLMENLQTLVSFSSDDDTVLTVTGWEVIGSEFSDYSTVRVYYDVLREGSATVTAGGAAAQTAGGEAVTSRLVLTETGEGEQGTEEETTGAGDAPGETEQPAGETLLLPDAAQDGETRYAFSVVWEDSDGEGRDEVVAAPAEEGRELYTGSVIYALPEALAGALSEGRPNTPAAAQGDITPPMIEREEREPTMLAQTGAGALVLMLLGAAASLIDYRRKRGYRI